MSNQDNMNEVFRTGVVSELAFREHRLARKNLTGDDLWIVDIAIPSAISRWLRAGQPEGGAEQFADEEIRTARERVEEWHRRHG